MKILYLAGAWKDTGDGDQCWWYSWIYYLCDDNTICEEFTNSFMGKTSIRYISISDFADRMLELCKDAIKQKCRHDTTELYRINNNFLNPIVAEILDNLDPTHSYHNKEKEMKRLLYKAWGLQKMRYYLI